MNKYTRLTEFHNVNIGQKFKYRRDKYMKVVPKTFYDGGLTSVINAVNLDEGVLAPFYDEAVVSIKRTKS